MTALVCPDCGAAGRPVLSVPPLDPDPTEPVPPYPVPAVRHPEDVAKALAAHRRLGCPAPPHPEKDLMTDTPAVGEQLRDLVTDALTCDGGHHKQWYLEQIAQLVLSPFEREHFQAEYDYDKGIAP